MLKKGWFIRCRCFWASFCFSTGHSTPALRYKKSRHLPYSCKSKTKRGRNFLIQVYSSKPYTPNQQTASRGNITQAIHRTALHFSFPKYAQCCLPGEVQHIPNGIAAFPDRRNDDDRHQNTGKSDVSQRLHSCSAIGELFLRFSGEQIRKYRQCLYVLSRCFSKYVPPRNIPCMIGHPSFSLVHNLL